MMARSSQVRSTERRLGVSMAEVVMDDMAIGNPVSPCGPALALWASFPGIHIAQFPYQVIGNCGLIFLMQCNNLPQGKKTWRAQLVLRSGCKGWSMEFFAGTATAFVRWRCAQYDGILALAACEHFGRSRG